MAIEHGSIEVFDEAGNNYGTPITPLYPFDEASGKEASQVKQRMGVQLGSMSAYPGGDPPDGLHRGSQWSGTTQDGTAVTVRIWKTAD